jgi:hypothetical protein
MNWKTGTSILAKSFASSESVNFFPLGTSKIVVSAVDTAEELLEQDQNARVSVLAFLSAFVSPCIVRLKLCGSARQTFWASTVTLATIITFCSRK